MHRSSLLAILLTIGYSTIFGQTIAQPAVPEAPSPTAKGESRNLIASSELVQLRVSNPVDTHFRESLLQVQTPERTRLSGKFILMGAITTAATIADVELTSRCLRAGTCREANPLFGSNPSQARMYGITVPILGGQMALAAWLKHRDPGSRAWLFPLLSGTAAHTVGSLTTIGK